MHRRFFLKNLRYSLACTLIPLLILSGLVAFVMVRSQRRDIDANNDNLLQQCQESIEAMVTELDYMNISISADSQMRYLLESTFNAKESSASRSALSQAIRRHLLPATAARPYVKSMYVYADNPYGRFITQYGEIVTLQNYVDRSWYDSYLAHLNFTGTIWCEPRSFREYGFLNEDTHVISFYKRFFFGAGVYVLNVHPSYFEEKLDRMSIYPNQSIVALNEKNQILFHNDVPLYLVQEELKEIPFSENPGAQSREINGERYYIVQRTSDLYGWRFISMIPHDSLYEPVNRMLWSIVMVSLLAMLFCVLLSYLSVRRSYRNVLKILTLFEEQECSAEVESPLTPEDDLYGFIIQNIAKTYIHQNHLRQELLSQQYEARLLEVQALQNQISPHFLFNTLKSIFWMSFQLSGGKNNVSTMIENVTEILAYSLSDKEQMVTFSEEIQSAKAYIEIQQMRYTNRFSVTWTAQEEVLPLYTPKLLLQPLVENCMMHAFNDFYSLKPQISIALHLKEESVEILVADNGRGIEVQKLLEMRQQLAGEGESPRIGLHNCNRRLQLLFGKQYGISIQSQEENGTTMKIVMPRLVE